MTERRDLLDVFTPPPGHVGYCAALVAMTGEADFLEAATRRFTNLSPSQRTEFGELHVYLMLDGHASFDRTETFPPGHVPGLYELQPRKLDRETLIHAKLAVLGFSTSHTSPPAYFRLAVFTSNLTYASASQHLELVWSLDVPSANAPAVDRADLAEAAGFTSALLRTRFQHVRSPVRTTGGLMSRLDNLLQAIEGVRPKQSASRFVHSLSEPLFPQIQRRFRRHTHTRRNFLLCGSAFYEQPTKGRRQPAVLKKLASIADQTANSQWIALVEPGQAGAIADWAPRASADGWKLARPSDLACSIPRRLHAKFIYLGYLRSGRIGNGSLYLGSGNLTRRGLFSDGSTRGNIECGVVLPVTPSLEQNAFGQLLFWDEEAPAIADADFQIGDVGDTPERGNLIATPPILAAYLTHRSLKLVWSDEPCRSVGVSWAGQDWRDVSERPAEIVFDDSVPPAVLQVRDSMSGQTWRIPVVGETGRVAWTPSNHSTYADAIEALFAFPLEADGEPDAEDLDIDGPTPQPASTRYADDVEPSYALYAAAQLVERLAVSFQ